MSSHCRHCDPNLCGWPPEWHMEPNTAATWLAGHCPACAEAERIADAIEATLDQYPAEFASTRAALRHAARIARGEA